MAETKETGIVQYVATDGCDVKLSPAIVMKYIMTGNGCASNKDLFSFMAKCQARGLNPLAGDCYMTVFQNRDGSTTTSVIVSKDYFIRTATKRPDYDGMKAGIVVKTVDGVIEYREGCLYLPNKLEKNSGEQLLGGWAEIYSKNRTYPSKAVVSLEEYDQQRSLWNTKKATMIRKVAVVQAIREAYPEQFGGLYDKDEMDNEPLYEPIEEQEPIEEEEF